MKEHIIFFGGILGNYQDPNCFPRDFDHCRVADAARTLLGHIHVFLVFPLLGIVAHRPEDPVRF